MTYDGPIEDEKSDVLGRVHFAKEVATIAGDAPWPVRVGVYGGWGTGKSSVLKLCRRELENRKHIVAEFNPWGFSATTDMLWGLVEAVTSAAEKSEVELPGGLRKLRERWREFKPGMESAAEVVETFAPGGKAWVPALKKAAIAIGQQPWATKYVPGAQQELAIVQAQLPKGSRLVVLIDDVDRLDPKLLPGLLFALHEVLSLEQLRYVVALDPDVVSAALSDYHPGFGSGFDFLEKIIQFPMRLPDAGTESLVNLAVQEAKEHAEWLPEEVVRENDDLLPTNPRTLRTTMRMLWRFQRDAPRHNADELDHQTLLLTHMLRHEFRPVFDEVRSRFDELLVPYKIKEREEKLAKLPSITCGQDQDQDRVIRLLLRLFEPSRLLTAERLEHHASLSEKTPAVTWKEFLELLKNTGTTPDVDALNDWIVERCDSGRFHRKAVIAKLAELALQNHEFELNEASHSYYGKGQIPHINSAYAAIQLVRTLTLECTPDVRIDAQLFRRICNAVIQWAQFERAEYAELRNAEKQLVLTLASKAESPSQFLESLEPWHSDRDGQQQKMIDSLVAELLPQVVEELDGIFQRKHAIQHKVLGKRGAPFAWIMLHESAFWNGDRLDNLRQLVRGAPSVVLAENCERYFRALVKDTFPFGVSPDKQLQNEELTNLLWKGVVCLRCNDRYLNNLRDLKNQAEERLGRELPTPQWLPKASDDDAGKLSATPPA